MIASAVLNRAHSACNKGTTYKLGKGGFNVGLPLPSASGTCDCSGFVSWALGITRNTKEAFYVKYNGGWIETTAVAGDIAASTGIFEPLDAPIPGCIVVYGDHTGADGHHHEGHIAVVTKVNGKPGLSGIEAIVHCSVGNDKTGDAIQETAATVFQKNPKAMLGWCILVDKG